MIETEHKSIQVSIWWYLTYSFLPLSTDIRLQPIPVAMSFSFYPTEWKHKQCLRGGFKLQEWAAQYVNVNLIIPLE